MPNWTGNRLSIIGTPEELNLFEADRVAALKEYDCDDEQVITFNMVLPMPKELVGTTSPRPRTEDQVRQDAKDWNWPEESLQRALASCLTPELAVRLDELKAKFGADNWYDWCNNNWGTKWDACHAAIEPPIKGSVVISFDTAWCEPQPVIHALVRKYPNLNFVHSYSYEGYCFPAENTNFTVDYRMNEGVIEAMVSISTDTTDYEPWEDVSHLVN